MKGRFGRAMLGAAQWVGRREITEPAFPRLALSSWTATLSEAAPLRRRVLVTAFRNHTWIEWAVYAACHLRRLGVATTLVYSGSEVRRLYPMDRLAGLRAVGFWAGVDAIPDLRTIDLDDWRPTSEEAEGYREFARQFAPTVAAYDLHVEEDEEGPLASRYRRARVHAEEQLADTGAAIERIMGMNPVSRVVCYSGLIGRSPAVCEAARRVGIEVLTVEGWKVRPGHMICNLNEPALESNVEEWLRATGPWGPSEEERALKMLHFQERGAVEEETATFGVVHRVQRTSTEAPLPPRIEAFYARPGPRFLLAPNVVGDSAMLRRRAAFRNQRDWLSATIPFFKAHPQWNLVVRAHPDEMWIKSKVVVRMGDVAVGYAEDAPNVLVIGGEEDVSSYALMRGLTGGLVWCSSIGADLVARGIPVIAAARPKYHELGLTQVPQSREAYLTTLERHVATPPKVTLEQRERALRYLHMIFADFSFEAFSPSYRARDLFLLGPESPADADLFYRIVAGDLPPETPPRREGRAS